MVPGAPREALGVFTRYGAPPNTANFNIYRRLTSQLLGTRETLPYKEVRAVNAVLFLLYPLFLFLSLPLSLFESLSLYLPPSLSQSFSQSLSCASFTPFSLIHSLLSPTYL